MATHVLEYPFLPLEKVYDLETPELSRNLRDVVIAASTPGFNVELLPHLERQVQLIQRELMERNAALLSEQQAHGCGDDTIQVLSGACFFILAARIHSLSFLFLTKKGSTFGFRPKSEQKGSVAQVRERVGASESRVFGI